MNPKSAFLLPPKRLSSFIAAAIIRDTRGVDLGEHDRFNYFPSTPLVSVTNIVEGELRKVAAVGDISLARQASAMPDLAVEPPQDHPTMSWSVGDVYAVTVGFYSDAWVALGFDLDDEKLPDPVHAAFAEFLADRDPEAAWARFCNSLVPLWEKRRRPDGVADWPGSDQVADWARYIFSRIAMSAPGKSVRTLERRLKRWTGKTRQELDHYASIEDLHRRVVENPDAPLASIANDAGYSDQSHMGRAVRQATGFSPAKLNRLIQTDEAFWCYRLLGERY